VHGRDRGKRDRVLEVAAVGSRERRAHTLDNLHLVVANGSLVAGGGGWGEGGATRQSTHQ
jgi:hypothetical protein